MKQIGAFYLHPFFGNHPEIVMQSHSCHDFKLIRLIYLKTDFKDLFCLALYDLPSKLTKRKIKILPFFHNNVKIRSQNAELQRLCNKDNIFTYL